MANNAKDYPTTPYKLGVGETIGQHIEVSCADCCRSTCHKVLASVDITDSLYDLVYDHSENFQIIQCQGCKTISFQQITRSPYDGPGADWVEYCDRYPSLKGSTPIKDSHFLPPSVKRIYIETVEAINSNLSVLAGIGIRALIETICVDKNAVGKNLVCKIDNLVQIGILTPEGAEILHKLRSMGNESAHKVKTHDRELLILALDVAEHLLRGVYILPLHTKRVFN